MAASPDSPLLAKCMSLARAKVKKHTVTEEGERFFNLFTFLEDLEYDLETLFSDMRFELDAHQTARFLWCCLAPDPSGNTFRGMAILD